jgi:hypothetical protein
LLYKLSFIIFSFALAVASTVYSKPFATLYMVPEYEHFDHFMKCMGNQKAYKPRSFVRNLVFNLWRCMTNETVKYFFLGGTFTQEDIVFRMATVAFWTLFFQFICPKSFID